MNLHEKVDQLLRYCGAYQGHAYMMDERGDGSFHIPLPEEKELHEDMKRLQVILLTGEAGDGKTRLLSRLKDDFRENGFSVCLDFSAEPEEEKLKIIQMVSDIVNGMRPDKVVVAANIGVFTRYAFLYQEDLISRLSQDNERIRVINFERRNLAADKDTFKEIVKTFLCYEAKEKCAVKACPWNGDCMYQRNLEFLNTDQGIESIRVLCDAVFLTGEHVTFRELLSILSFAVTFGQDCQERQTIQNQERYSYESIFSYTKDKMLQKVSRLDPANRSTVNLKTYETIEDCRKDRRSNFFLSVNKYELLDLDYISEFRQALELLGKRLYIDTSMVQEGVLYRVKRGLTRISKRGQSDMGVTIADTPVMLGDDIQTEFELTNLDIVFNRPGIDFDHIENAEERGSIENRFCMSYVYQEKENGPLKSISMIIDYNLFRYLLMADEYYYINRSNQSMEEYAVNMFFRKILRIQKGAYHRMQVVFNGEQHKERRNFSLSLLSRNSVLSKGTKYIKIKSEL